MNALQRAGVQTCMTETARLSPHPAFTAIRLISAASVAAHEGETWENTALAPLRRRDARTLISMARAAFAK